jgi:hypothetical protein
MMRHGIYWIVIAAFVIVSSEIVPLASGETVLSTGVRFNSFRDDRTEETEGTEFTFPVSLMYTRERFSLSLVTAYGRALVNQPDGSEPELSHFTDTLLSAAYTIPQLPLGLFCFAGVNVNLPTGKTQLTKTEEYAIVGENNDLFEVESFGEGLNIGVNLSVMRQFGKITVGVNGTYVYKGEYDPTKEIPDDDLDPGDQILVAGVLNWEVSSQIKVSPLVTYSYFSVDKVNGEENFQQGRTITVGSTLRYTRSPIGVTLSVQDSMPQKNKELVAGSLETEPENSNTNTLSALLDVTYVHSQALALRAVGDIRYYEESERKDKGSGLPYSGKRIRYSFGPGVWYAVNKKISLSALAKYILMNEEKSIYLDQDTTYQGIAANVEAAYTF